MVNDLFFSALGNEKLTCIEVDNPRDLTNNSSWKKEDMAIYSQSCQTASVDDIIIEKVVTIIPNPVREILKIKLEELENFYRCTVFNNLRQEILKSFSNQIDISFFKKGIYLLKIECKDQREIIKSAKEITPF